MYNIFMEMLGVTIRKYTGKNIHSQNDKRKMLKKKCAKSKYITCSSCNFNEVEKILKLIKKEVTT